MTIEENMAVNIIIPIKDTPVEYFEQCLYSLASQTRKSFLTTVINDGSTVENTQIYKEIINKMPFNVMYLEHEICRGAGPARQTGVNNALPPVDYFFFLDADDMLFPNTIRTLYQEAKVNKEPEIVAGQIFVEGEHPSKDGQVDTKIMNAWVTGKLFKRDFLDKYNIKFLDKKMLGAEDSYFGLVATNLAKKRLFVARDIYYWRHNPNSTTRDRDNNFTIEANVDHTYSQYAATIKLMEYLPDWNYGGILGVFYSNYQFALGQNLENQIKEIEIILKDFFNIEQIKDKIDNKDIIKEAYKFVEIKRGDVEFPESFSTWRNRMKEKYL